MWLGAIPIFVIFALLALWSLPVGYAAFMGVDRVCFRRAATSRDLAILVALFVVAVVATIGAFLYWSTFR